MSSTNATWWVRYTDRKKPLLGEQTLSIASPDLKDPNKAHQRARLNAKARLQRKGIDPIILSSRCVG